MVDYVVLSRDKSYFAKKKHTLVIAKVLCTDIAYQLVMDNPNIQVIIRVRYIVPIRMAIVC
jgi:hypothetical protein